MCYRLRNHPCNCTGTAEAVVRGRNPAQRERHTRDQRVSHNLLEHHERIEREVKELPDGIHSITRSRDPEVIRPLHDHVPSLHERPQINLPLRRRDPLCAELFEHRDRITMEIGVLEDGVEVIETGDDPWVAQLVKAHGEAVNAFAKQGLVAAQRPSPMPASMTRENRS